MEVNEPAVAYEKRKYSIEEYLELENAATEKHEYYQGEIFAMSGARGQHNHVTSNLLGELMAKLKGRSCKPFGSDLRIHIEKNTLFTYPDISVFCGPFQSINNDDLNFLNPTVIFEVLSPATRKYDLDAKFKLYQDIPSLRSYVTVDPMIISVQAWHLNDSGKWVLTSYTNVNETLQLHSIDVALPLIDVYDGTEVAAK